MSSQKTKKILAIQFKYFGDVVFITPALRALKQHFPAAELHVLVAAEIAPLLENLTWITKVWAMPRKRGKATLNQSLPFVNTLRRERFYRTVDFGGNDRGAVLSWLSGAPIRLSYAESKQKLLQKFCYSQTMSIESLPQSWVAMHLQLLSAWQVKSPSNLQLEIKASEKKLVEAQAILPPNTVICHLATSQPKKEWPATHWQTLYHLAKAQGVSLIFSSGINPRERQLLSSLNALDSTLPTLAAITDLPLFLAVLQQASLVIAGDTGPLHLAAGLGVSVIGLYGTGDSICRAAPNYPDESVVKAPSCACDSLPKLLPTCSNATHCMSLIQPKQVMEKMQHLLNLPKVQFTH